MILDLLPICFQCMQPISNEQYIIYDQHKYHHHCFRCFQCNQTINESKFHTKNSKPCCNKCYDQYLALRCFQCNQIITTGQYYSENNKPCCIRCYEQYFAPKCEKCFKSILNETAIVYDGKKYHSNCFRCIECNQVINTTKFGTKNNRPLCVSCHNNDLAPKCYRCFKSINGKYTTYQGNNFHIECFVCDKCHRVIYSNQEFYNGHSGVLCSLCVK